MSCFVLIVTLVFQLLYFGFQSNFQSAKRPAAHMTGLKQVNPSGGCWPNRLPNSSTSSSYLGPKRIKVAVRNSLRVDTRRSGSSATNMQKGPLLQSKSKTCQTCKTCETRQACKTSKTCDCSICSRPLQGLTRWKSRIPAAHQSMERKPGDSFPIRGLHFGVPGTRISSVRLLLAISMTL